jgi:DNA-binding GntR family transcriptional regulator
MMAANHEADSPKGLPLSAYRIRRGGRGNAVADTTHAHREAILDGVLAPNEWLREESLKEILGVSRTPVREALNRLEEEGLIARTPGQGARVTTLTIEDMSVVYLVRGNLESLTARMAAEHGSQGAKMALQHVHDGMHEASKQGDRDKFSRLNIEFHQALTEMAGNAYLTRLLATVETAIRRFGTRSYNRERMTQIVLEHAAVVNAVVSGNGDAASHAAIEHANHARAATLDRFLNRI